MKKGLFIFLLGFPFVLPLNTFAQKGENELIQFSGMVLTSDSSKPVPYTTIMILNSGRGTIANLQGFYSLVVKKKDTIRFSAVGFKPEKFVIPPNFKGRKLKLIQTMHYDTLLLKEAVVSPLPSKEEFRQAFLNLNLKDDLFTLAKKNLNTRNLQVISSNMGMGPAENQIYTIQQRAARAYYESGQRPYFYFGETTVPGSLMNPAAWYKFIKALKNGDFLNHKKQEYRYPND